MRILFIAHRLPYAPNRGDRIRAYHLLHELSKWAEVDVCALAHDDDEASHTGDLKGLVKSVTAVRVPRVRNLMRAVPALLSSTPLTHILLDSPELANAVDRAAAARRPDVVLCFCTGIGPVALRPSLAGIPIVLDMVDVDSVKWDLLSRSASFPMSWIYAREARRLAQFEADIATRAAATIVVTEAERQHLIDVAPGAHAHVIGVGVDIEFFEPRRIDSPPAAPTVVFCGMMDYAPNVEGMQWFVKNIWPIVRARVQDARLMIVGANPSAAVKRLANDAESVHVTGAVPDVRPFLWNASVAVAPLLTARGVQTKVLEYTAAGLRAVVTPAVSKGLPPDLEQLVVVAGTAQDFADAVVSAATSPRTSPRPAFPKELSWTAQLALLRSVVETAQHSTGGPWR